MEVDGKSSAGSLAVRLATGSRQQNDILFSLFIYSYLVQTTSAAVNVTVLNVNDWDPRFRYPQYEFFLPHVPLVDLRPGTVIGKVEAADGDKGDSVTLSLRGPHEK